MPSEAAGPCGPSQVRPESAALDIDLPPLNGTTSKERFCPCQNQRRSFHATRKERTGLTVQLPGWRYPVVCDTSTGAVKFDNYGGAWGKQAELNRFLQGYAVEKAKIEARKKGYRVAETKLEDGSIKVTVTVGGGVA